MDNQVKTYSVEDIQKMLGVGRSVAYSFINEAYRNKAPFRVLKVGVQYRIPKSSFDRWLEGTAM